MHKKTSAACGSFVLGYESSSLCDYICSNRSACKTREKPHAGLAAVFANAIYLPLPVAPRIPQFFSVVADVATEEGCSTLAAEADRLMDGIDGLVSFLSVPRHVSMCPVSHDEACMCREVARIPIC